MPTVGAFQALKRERGLLATRYISQEAREAFKFQALKRVRRLLAFAIAFLPDNVAGFKPSSGYAA